MSEHEERIDLTQGLGAYSNMNLTDCIKEMHDVRQKLDRADEVKKGYQKMYDFLSIIVVPAKMDEAEIDLITVTDVGRVNLRGDLWLQTKDGRALAQWLVQHKLDDIIKPGVNSSTLKALIKERMRRRPTDYPEEADRDLPDADIVKVTPFTRAVITKT